MSANTPAPSGRAAFVLLTLLAVMPYHASSAGAVGHAGASPQRAERTSDTARLPSPARQGKLSLEEALSRRRSIRDFADQRLDEATIGQLLWAAQGITHRDGRRTAPSAGALYPLEFYAATADGLFHYEPGTHGLTRRAPGDVRAAIARAALGQESVREAPLLIVVTAVHERTSGKYGGRAERYVHMEAGHAAQNVLLQATALGLGAVPVGAFDDDALARALALGDRERPLYLIPVGRPRG